MKIVKAAANQLTESEANLCAEALRRGEVICYPTETFYAFGIDPRNDAASDKLYALKGRGTEKQLPLIAAEVEMVRRCCVTHHPAFDSLAREFWPGPLTLVLPAAQASVAIRVSSHPIARQISRVFDRPIVSTSVNKSGAPPIADPRQIQSLFGEDIAILVDGGISTGGLSSTIVSLMTEKPTILRHGAIPEARLISYL